MLWASKGSPSPFQATWEPQRGQLRLSLLSRCTRLSTCLSATWVSLPSKRLRRSPTTSGCSTSTSTSCRASGSHALYSRPCSRGTRTGACSSSPARPACERFPT
eukprot:Amastigsp_a346774_13.p4 type:complete len:104 gc:universal Amastigsp_a346774_13:208-519(+)